MQRKSILSGYLSDFVFSVNFKNMSGTKFKFINK